MTATQIVTKRTGASPEDVAFYIELADARIIAYLGLESGADISPYMMQESDIAVLYFQRDTGERNSVSALGYKSESFSEGQMSESHTVAEGSETRSADYEAAILAVLHTLDDNEQTAGLAVMY